MFHHIDKIVDLRKSIFCIFTNMPYKDPSKRKDYRDKNKEKIKDYREKYYYDLTQRAIESITSGEIGDRNKWDMWCNRIKSKAKKHPYSDDFTNDIMFEMMKRGCFYCGDIATTIDRLNSKIEHTPNNCVGSCWGCNNSKGTADPATFIRKTYFLARGKYIDDVNDIWFVYKQKPFMHVYKRNALKKGVPFELVDEDWSALIIGDCEYCHRSPSTWFGIDRKIPSKGYVTGNVVSCCFDCNVYKFEGTVEEMIKRNGMIADRVDARELVIKECEKGILHKGINKTSKRVYVYGQVYASMSEGSRALGKNDTYIRKCIKNNWHSNDIFEISEDAFGETFDWIM